MAADEPESPAWQHGGIKVVVALLYAGVAATKSAAMTMERLSFENDTKPGCHTRGWRHRASRGAAWSGLRF